MEKSQILQQQHETWNKFSPGWKKWDGRVMKGFEPIGDALIKAVGLKNNFEVLDVATGTGEPGHGRRPLRHHTPLPSPCREAELRTRKPSALSEGGLSLRSP